MFKTLKKDNTEVEISIIGARSQGSNQAVASVNFGNYDDDTMYTYRMGEISVYDHFGNAASNGFGDMTFKTNSFGATSGELPTHMIINYQGNVGIGTTTPEARLHVAGNLKADNINADTLTVTTFCNSVVLSNFEVEDGSITTSKLADGAVTTSKLTIDGDLLPTSSNSIDIGSQQLTFKNAYFSGVIDCSNLLLNGQPFGTVIDDGTITTQKLADSNVTSEKLAADSVLTVHIRDSNVTTSKLADSVITTQKLADSNVTSEKLAAANVLTIHLADSNVTTSKLADSVITAQKLADSNVTSEKLAAANVLTIHLADSNVITSKILDSAVTTEKMADQSVTSAKFADNLTFRGTSTFSNIDTSNITASQQALLYNTTLRDGTDIYDALIAYGPVTLSNQTDMYGALTITGPITASNTLTVYGTLTAQSNIVGLHDATFCNNVDVYGTFHAHSNAIFDSNADVLGDLTVTETIVGLSNLIVEGSIEVKGEVIFGSGQVSIAPDGNIYRNGVSTILDRILYIKEEQDFGTLSNGQYYLKPGISYRLDGIVTVNYPLVCSEGTTLVGAGYEDGLFFTSNVQGACIYVEDHDFVSFFMSYQAPFNELFCASNIQYNSSGMAGRTKRFQLFSVRITNTYELGRIDGFSTINVNNSLIQYCSGPLTISNGLSFEFLNNKVVLWMTNGPYPSVNARAPSTKMIIMRNNNLGSNNGYGLNVVNIGGNIIHPRALVAGSNQTGLYIEDGSSVVQAVIGGNTFITETSAKLIDFENAKSFNDYRTYEVVGNSGILDQKGSIEIKQVGLTTTLGTTYQYIKIEPAHIVNQTRMIIIGSALDGIGEGFFEYQDAKVRRLLFWVLVEVQVTGGNPNTRFNLNAYMTAEYGYTGPTNPITGPINYGTITDLSLQTISKGSVQGNLVYGFLTFSTIYETQQYTRFRILFNNEQASTGLSTTYNYHVVVSPI